MQSSPVLITGCGRSGTKYTAVALSALGYPCAHEAVFHPDVLANTESQSESYSGLATSVPKGSSTILISSDRENARVVGRRLVLPFVEKAGQYWGLPPTDEKAIQELERLRALGADFIAVSSDASWVLKYYSGFAAHLRANYPIVQDNDEFFVCRLSRDRHESDPGFTVANAFYWPTYFRGEASWVAAPFLDSLPEGSVVLHQVRHPLGVIRSFGRMGFFDQNQGPFRRFAEAHCPTVSQGTVLERLMSYWMDWNLMVEKASELPGLTYLRYRIEDMSPSLMKRICEYGDFQSSNGAIEATLDSLPTNFHTRGSKAKDHEIDWETLPNPRLRGRLTDLAERYGYPRG